MRRWRIFDVLWALLLLMWLLLNETLEAADLILGACVVLTALWGLRALQEPQTRLREPLIAAELAWIVLGDVVRSNIAVASIVLHAGTRGRTAGFVEIPLTLRNPVGLAALACIITSTPGTAWAGYDSRSGVLTMHVLDLVDKGTWVRTIQDRYERRLMEIFQ